MSLTHSLSSFVQIARNRLGLNDAIHEKAKADKAKRLAKEEKEKAKKKKP